MATGEHPGDWPQTNAEQVEPADRWAVIVGPSRLSRMSLYTLRAQQKVEYGGFVERALDRMVAPVESTARYE